MSSPLPPSSHRGGHDDGPGGGDRHDDFVVAVTVAAAVAVGAVVAVAFRFTSKWGKRRWLSGELSSSLSEAAALRPSAVEDREIERRSSAGVIEDPSGGTPLKNYRDTSSDTRPHPLVANEASSSSQSSSLLAVCPIGRVRSVYRLCVGTPRQGMLAPHSRGRIELDSRSVSPDILMGLDGFSHAYVVFVFHLNSNVQTLEKSLADAASGNGGKKGGGGRGGGRSRQFPSKIAPPSLGGERVGVFSTRTPHRPNPIGFSLCRIDSVSVPGKGKKNSKKGNRGGADEFCIRVSGLDLVDGTPVLDIKPYVPHYDCVGHSSQQSSRPRHGDNGAEATRRSVDDDVDGIDVLNVSRVPHWVGSGLQKKRSVTFLPSASESILELVRADRLEFYGPSSGWADDHETAASCARQCVAEVLGADVRSPFQAKKARKGRHRAERTGRVKEAMSDKRENSQSDNDGGEAREDARLSVSKGQEERVTKGGDRMCTQQIDNMLVWYTIEPPGGGVDSRSKESGAEDVVVVHYIAPI